MPARLPNFMIVGAAKSGTTSLYDYLGQHPDVFFPHVKEPHFFSNSQPKYPHTYDIAAYKALFRGANGHSAVGEASVSYLTDPVAARRIHDLIGDVKIIIVLRNPVERAFSHWRHYSNRLLEPLSFEDALAQESDRAQNQTFLNEAQTSHSHDYLYFRNGLYSEQIQRFFDIFGRKNVQIVLTDDLNNEAEAVIRSLYQFIEVDPEFTPDFSIKNKSCAVVNPRLQRWLTTDRPSTITRVYNRLPAFLQRYVYLIGKTIYWRNLAPSPKGKSLGTDMRVRLTHRYQDEIRGLASLLNRDLSSWLKPISVMELATIPNESGDGAPRGIQDLPAPTVSAKVG